MPVETDIILAKWKGMTSRDGELHLDQIQTSDRLGDRMLDLEAGVDLEEGDGPVRPKQELDRAGTAVADMTCERDRSRAKRVAHGRLEAGGRGLLDHLLVASLHRAVALTKVNDRPMRVRHDLHLDVAAVLDIRLDEHRWIAESGERLAPGRLDRPGEILGAMNHPHPAAPTAGRRLHEGGHGDPLRWRTGQIDGVDGGRRHTSGDGRPLGGDLVAEQLDLLGGGTNPDEACRFDGACRRWVLGEEAVARVHRIAAGRERSGDDGVDPQIRLRGCRSTEGDRPVHRSGVQRSPIGLGVNADRGDAESAGGARDPHRDFPTVRDE